MYCSVQYLLIYLFNLIILFTSESECCLRRPKVVGKYPVDMSDCNYDTPGIIRKYGFPAEVHNFVSEDGYVIVLHRIPAPGKPPVLVAHGGMGTSKQWFFANTGSVRESFALELASAGFDVWFHNSRGNEYSKGHVNISMKNMEYWDFRLDEQAAYDVPQAIDYILDTTGKKKLGYVGVSFGTIIFFKAMAAKPEYNEKVFLMVGYGNTAGYLSNVTGPTKIAGYFVQPEEPVKTIVDALFRGYILPPILKTILPLAYQFICTDGLLGKLCDGILLYALGGKPGSNIDDAMLCFMRGGWPSRTSIRTAIQISQGLLYPELRIASAYYDYGAEINLRKYGTILPKQYDMTLVSCPIVLFSGISDAFNSVNDVAFLGSFFPNLIEHRVINKDGYFGHLDFVVHMDAPDLIFRPSFEYLKEFARK